MAEIKLKDLKSKTPTELLAFAEEHEVEAASTLRKQELMFAILKQLASNDIDIIGEGVVEVLADGFGFLRSPDSNYLLGRMIFIFPLRKFGVSVFEPAIRWKVKSAAPKMANAILLYSKSTVSISKILKKPSIRSILTI